MNQPLDQSLPQSLSQNLPPVVQAFFDPATWTISYVVYENDGAACAIIDSVLDYDAKSGRTGTGSADQLIAFIRAHDLRTTWILETHAHADHLSAAPYLRQQLGGRIAIGDKIKEVQGAFHKIFNLGPACPSDGAQFDHLFHAGESFKIGNLDAHALAVPGHTPADMAYQIGDAVFTGDTLFMPDVGTARCDFPGGNPHILYQSVQAILALPPETRLYMCHDYPPEGRGPAWQCSVAQQRSGNIHIHDGIDEAAFVAMRTRRDATLSMPTLILPAIQVNIHAGQLPAAEENGIRYLKIPINAL